MARPKHVKLLFNYPSFIAPGGDEFVLLHGPGPTTLVVNAASWPPKITTLAQVYALDAARDASGAWLLHACTGNGQPRVWSLRWLPPGAAATTDTAELPIDQKKLDEAIALLSEKEAEGERPHRHVVDELLLLGDDLLMVPRLAGVGLMRWPWLYEQGTWREQRSLPPYETATDDPKRVLAKTLRLGDGTPVLLWDRGVFERRGGEFHSAFLSGIQAPWYTAWEPAPCGDDGFFYLSTESELIEIHRRGEPVVHLPGVSVRGVWPGPAGSVLVQTDEDVMVYDPVAGTVATLDRAVVKQGDKRFFQLTTAGLVIGRDRPGGLDLYPAAAIAALPRRPVAQAVQGLKPPTKDPAPTLDGPWSASRPRVAARQRHVAIAVGRTLRGHDVDTPRWRQTMPAELVAVVAHPEGFASLDATGQLRVHHASDGRVTREEHVIAAPRSLAASRTGTLAVLGSDGVVVIQNGKSSAVDFGAPISAGFDDRGTLLLTGEGRRAALVDDLYGSLVLRELPAPPDDVRAVAARADGTWLAMAGRWLCALDPRTGDWSPYAREHLGPHVAVSPDGLRHAVTSSKTSVLLGHYGSEETVSLAYPEAYSDPSEQPIEVTGLAYLDDERLVVALTHGRANICTGTGVLKVDPFDDEANARWIFVYGGAIMVAG